MPYPLSQNWFRTALIVSTMLLANGHAIGQPPYELPKEATETDLQEVVVPLSDAVKQKIAEALARDAREGSSGSTGDPILDDVLNVIRQQGSVLDGSTLDPQSSRTRESAQMGTPVRENESLIVPDGPFPLRPNEIEPLHSGPDAHFHVAESLLRAARELAALPGRDQQRSRLIAAMREQATVLMIDEFSQSPIDTK